MCLATVIKYGMFRNIIAFCYKKNKNKSKLMHLKIPRLLMSVLSSPGNFPKPWFSGDVPPSVISFYEHQDGFIVAALGKILLFYK